MNTSTPLCGSWLAPLSDVAGGLSQRAGYSNERALKIAAELEHLEPCLHEAFRAWWDLGCIPEQLNILGYTVRSLIEEGRCKSVPVAFTWLNGLAAHPQETLKRVSASYDIISADPTSDLGLGQPYGQLAECFRSESRERRGRPGRIAPCDWLSLLGPPQSAGSEPAPSFLPPVTHEVASRFIAR